MPRKRKSTAKAKAASVRVKRKPSSRLSRGVASHAAGRFVLPLIISGFLLLCLAFVGFSGYETATASEFFGLRHIDVRGNVRTPDEDIRRVVVASAQKPGVWNADLGEIREKLEKFPFVKSAAVSRALPAGLRVNVTERVPAAVVKLSSGDFLIDGEATLLVAASKDEKDFPFTLRGWDEAKTEKASVENLSRLKLYRKMLDEWKQFDLSKRVKEVNLADMREPTALIEDSGRPISIFLSKDNLGKGLKTAIEAVSGKGTKIKTVNAAGIYPVIQYVD